MAGLDDLPPGTPASAPPPGVAPDYVDPTFMGPSFVALGIFLSLSLLAVFVRIFVRFRITKAWGWDDYTCIKAAIGSVIYAILYVKVSTEYPVRHIWEITLSSYASAIETQTLSVNGIVYQITIFFTKLSILLLYLRIFSVNQAFTRVTIASIVVLTLLYVPLAGLAIGFLAACNDLTNLLESPFCKHYSSPTLAFSAIFNVVTDLWLLLLPFPLLIKLQMQPRQKLGLAAVFAAGVGACAASVARLAEIIIHRNSSDPTWSHGIIAEFSFAEINIGIIVACSSVFPAFFSRVKGALRHAPDESKHTQLPDSEPDASQTT
ncbi:hypothetical protein F5B22DRAFT_540674 [Xylaria bambusicola]|uniref:uncharacterized protein n=1 Tax=Xylaria bambusicola TaxID=326684 RepID=UPI0020082E8D|nr:uncharacterized protein F5B22DRAFT_540674 [Xylaria bambusicola]KAI0521506.1 hypothetical protein F5B22DRAFT_540674 [Xylaria bambusicola]